MATQFLLTSLGPIIGSMSLETFLLRTKFPTLYTQSETLPGVPRSFGMVPTSPFNTLNPPYNILPHTPSNTLESHSSPIHY